MKDLEIRGAGNMLGGEQSGHIADVGFDLYIRLVGEAVAEYRGDSAEPEPEMRIELPIDAHLPTDYVESERLRLEMYKRLAEVKTEADVKGIEAELHDRYGAPTQPTLNLLEVARFRILAREAGITEVVSQGNYIRFGPAELLDSKQLRLKRLYPRSVVKETARHILVPRPLASTIGGPDGHRPRAAALVRQGRPRHLPGLTRRSRGRSGPAARIGACCRSPLHPRPGRSHASLVPGCTAAPAPPRRRVGRVPRGRRHRRLRERQPVGRRVRRRHRDHLGAARRRGRRRRPDGRAGSAGVAAGRARRDGARRDRRPDRGEERHRRHRRRAGRGAQGLQPRAAAADPGRGGGRVRRRRPADRGPEGRRAALPRPGGAAVGDAQPALRRARREAEADRHRRVRLARQAGEPQPDARRPDRSRPDRP